MRFICADVTKLDLEADSCDVIFSNWLLMYLDDDEIRSLSVRMLSWLKEGGILFVRESCFHPSGSQKLYYFAPGSFIRQSRWSENWREKSPVWKSWTGSRWVKDYFLKKNQFIEKVQHFLIDVIVDRFLNLFKWVKWNGNVNMRRSGVDLVVEFYLLAPVPNLTQYVRNEMMTLMKLITRRTWPWGKRGPMVPPFSDWLCLRCYVTASRRQVKRCSLVKSHSTPSMGCLKSWEI